MSTMPPGPRIPSPIQALIFVAGRQYLVPRWRRRYGDVFSVRLPGRHAVLLGDTDDIKTVWNGAPSVFHAGEGNSILRPVMGDDSVLVLDEDAHLRARKLLMPAFAGAALRGYRDMFTEIAEAQIGRWPQGTLALAPRMQALTLEVIMRVVFGITDESELAELRVKLPRLAANSPLMLIGTLYPRLMSFPPWRGFARTIREVDELLYRQISAKRSREPSTDVLSRLLSADDSGAGLSDTELRDELITLLLAGHETTATALSWTMHELMRGPAEMRRAVAAADGSSKEDDEYLEACVKEALRLRPVVPQVSRRLTAATEIGGYLLPAGTYLAPSMLLVQHDSRHHEQPFEYRPQRFIDGSASSVNFVTFGGGVRRCLGASFALLEATCILRVLLRTNTFTAPSTRPERVATRSVTLVPANGTRAHLRHRTPALQHSE